MVRRGKKTKVGYGDIFTTLTKSREALCLNKSTMIEKKMVEKLMDRYFDKPDAKFDLDIFEESIDLLIKYNDRDGVTTFWRLMEEMNVEPPEELREKVETFLVKAREASWYE